MLLAKFTGGRLVRIISERRCGTKSVFFVWDRPFGFFSKGRQPGGAIVKIIPNKVHYFFYFCVRKNSGLHKRSQAFVGSFLK
jgi:hypothetical protein